MARTVPWLRGEGRGKTPLTTACAPHLGLLRVLFEALRNDQTTDNNGKRSNYVQT